MTEKKIKVGPVCSDSLPVVVERENRPIWKRDTPNALSPTVVPILILIYIVSKMKNVIHGILAS